MCSKCRKFEVEYISPAKLCRFCWADWWVDGMEPSSENQRRRLRRETLRNITPILDR